MWYFVELSALLFFGRNSYHDRTFINFRINVNCVRGNLDQCFDINLVYM